MANGEVVEVAGKSKTEITPVKMSDGRTVNFAGKRKVVKETLIDWSKVEYDEGAGILQIAAGAVSTRMDFRSGETRTYELPLYGNRQSGIVNFAGHGGEQKYGDELATPADKPLSEDDMVLATDALNDVIQSGKWGVGRAAGGGGVSGAGIVVRAVMEVTGKDIVTVKAYFATKVAAEAQKPEDQRLTLRDMYNAFRAPGTKTAVVIKRMEDEKAAKNVKMDADAELASVGA